MARARRVSRVVRTRVSVKLAEGLICAWCVWTAFW